jgi:hypothetical protein
LGSFASHFGARAPLQDISLGIFTDLLKPRINDNTYSINYFVDYRYDWAKCLPLCIEDWFLVQDGIDFVLLDCWLLDDEFVSKVKQYEAWVVDESSELQDKDVIEHLKEKIEEEAIKLGL